MYDWFLGGVENYEADQRACKRVLDIAPEIRQAARSGRGFLQRAVQVLAKEYGVRQFIELGCGLPAHDNVHQVAQRVDPRSRVVYVDADPTALAYGRTTLQENANTLFLHADMRHTGYVFGHRNVQQLIDFREPVAVLMVSVLHCLADEDRPDGLVQGMAGSLAPGSFVAISQLVCGASAVRDAVGMVMQEETCGYWGRVRSEEQVGAFFSGLEVLPPGLGDAAAWRSGSVTAPPSSGTCVEWGGVARVPPGPAGL
ncbi:SAM-dependent methyltransferase [Streptomyces sp. NPDC059914]